MMTLFTLGTIAFWVLLVITITTVVGLVENNQNFLADIILTISLIILYKFGCHDFIAGIFSWIATHPLYAVLSILLYFILGTGFSIIKWTLFLIDGLSNLIKMGYSYDPYKWMASRYKSRIMHWMMYWPILGLWTVFSNPIVKGFKRIYDNIEIYLQSISDKIMKNVKGFDESKKKNK